MREKIAIRLLTFIHASLVEVFGELKRPRLVWETLLLDAGSQLFLEIINNDRECIDAGFVVGNDGGVEEAAAGEFVKVIARLHVGVHVYQYLRGCVACALRRVD